MRKAILSAMVADTRLSPGALRLVLDVALRGSGEHEIPLNHFSALLNHPGEKKLRAELQLAADFRYLDRRHGGRGHHDSYQFNPAVSAGLNADSPAVSAGLNDQPTTDKVALGAGLSAPSREGAPGPARGRADFRRDTTAGAGGAEPPIIPLSEAISQMINNYGDLLHGCRDALRDYLAQRVPLAKRAAYVHTIAAWLNDQHDVWRCGDGSILAPQFRTQKLGQVLNELAASDERSMRRTLGDPGNLRMKLGIRLRDIGNPYERNGTAGGAPAKARTETPRERTPGSGDQSHRRRQQLGG